MPENAAESHQSAALFWAGHTRPSNRKKRGRGQIQYTYLQPELQAEQIALAARQEGRTPCCTMVSGLLGLSTGGRAARLCARRDPD